MSKDDPFSEQQKQFLSGFTFGADVARAVSGLPVLSNIAGESTNVTLDSNGVSISDEQMPVGPERIALQAQADTIALGKKLCGEEKAKQAKNPLDMWMNCKLVPILKSFRRVLMFF